MYTQDKTTPAIPTRHPRPHLLKAVPRAVEERCALRVALGEAQRPVVGGVTVAEVALTDVIPLGVRLPLMSVVVVVVEAFFH